MTTGIKIAIGAAGLIGLICVAKMYSQNQKFKYIIAENKKEIEDLKPKDQTKK